MGETVAEYFTATSTTATSTFGGGLVVSFGGLNGSTANPSLAFGDGNTGFYESADNVLNLAIGGSTKWRFNTNGLFYVSSANGAEIRTEASSATNPVFIPDRADATAGLGGTGGGVSLITGGIEALKIDASQNVGIGTTSPYAKLSVVGETVAEYFTATSTTVTSTFGAGLTLSQTPGDYRAVPTLAFGDGDSGFYETSDDVINLSLNNTRAWVFSNSGLGYNSVNAGSLLNGVPSATSPGIGFSGDSNTGLGTAVADTLSLIAGGVNVANALSTGNFGIGTTSPYAKLSVVGETVAEYFTATSTIATSTFAGAMRVGTTTTTSSAKLTISQTDDDNGVRIYGWDDKSDNYADLYVNEYGNFIIDGSHGLTNFRNSLRVDDSKTVTLGSGSDYRLSYENGTTQLQLKTTDMDGAGTDGNIWEIQDGTDDINFIGNVGIGTTSPYAKLSVVGETVAEYFTATSTSATSTFGGGLNVGSGGLVYDRSTGFVGIGKTSPAQLLEVSGVDAKALVTGSSGAAIQLKKTGIPDVWSEWQQTGAGMRANSYDGTTLRADLVMITNSGNFGIGTSTPFSKFTVATGDIGAFNGAVCADDGGTSKCYGALTAGVVYGDSSSFVASDVAENYPLADDTIEEGDIVMVASSISVKENNERKNDRMKLNQKYNNEPQSSITDSLTASITKAQKGKSGRVIGIISTKPGVLLGDTTGLDLTTKFKPVALSGRIPLKVNLEGGDISKGDRITLSSTPGIGTKATTSSYTVGIALEDFTNSDINNEGYGKVLVFVNLGWSKLDPAISNGKIAETDKSAFWSIDKNTGNIDFTGSNIKNINSISIGNWSLDSSGLLVVDEIRANKLCLGGTCVDEGQLKALLDGSGIDGSMQTAEVTGSNSTTDTTPPTITLKGNNPAEIEIGSTYSDLGATIEDDIDKNLGYKVSLDDGLQIDIRDMDIDTSTEGAHTIVFTATDQAGNRGTATRTVVVYDPNGTGDTAGTSDETPDIILGCMDSDADNYDSSATEDDDTCKYPEPDDTVAPTITLNGESVVDLIMGGSYTEDGATATDEIDGDLTSGIIIGGDIVDTAIAGVYTVTYDVSDAAGNTATEVARTVNVVGPPAPDPAPETTQERMGSGPIS